MVSYQMATQGARSVLQLQFIKIPTQAHQFQAEPYRCSCRVASIIERIDLGCASNVMRVPICLTAPAQLLLTQIPFAPATDLCWHVASALEGHNWWFFDVSLV